MLIIGHRGAAGEKPENTLAAVRSGLTSGAELIEVDVRLTKDGQPVLAHDPDLKRTHGLSTKIRNVTLKELIKRTSGSARPICTLKEALSAAHGKVVINLELKEKGSGKAALEVCRDLGLADKESLELILFSSFSARELHRLRKLNRHVQLGLLHHVNPYLFAAWQRKLDLQAVGFHRLHVPRLAIELARQNHIFTYVYTVNRMAAVERLERLGVDGIVTDYPTKFADAV